MATGAVLRKLLCKVDNEVSDSMKLVIAIDIGTYASGYAYQFRDDYNVNPLQIFANKQWHSNAQRGGLYSYKTPTCLLLDEKTEFVNFGYDADYKYSRYNTEGVTGRPMRWANYYYFRNYKMAIYDRKELSDDTLIEAAHGKHLKAIVVFTRTIEFFRRELLKHFVKNGTIRKTEEPNSAQQLERLDLIDTTWVITVPAIWDEPAKQLMKRAAIEAGIKKENLVIALEPECAAIYCSQLSKSQLQIYEGEGNIKHVVHPGAVLMVVDIGGGTVDISVIQINDDCTMKQVHKSGGGAWGGVRINEKILESLRNMTGQEVMSDFSSKHSNEEYELRMEIETAKRKVNSPAKPGEMISEEEIFGFHIGMPRALKKIWKSKCETYKKILSDNEIKFEAGDLCFKSDKIREYFKDTVDGILIYLRDTLESSSGIKPSAMIVVGGFAESDYVIESLRERLQDKMIPVIRPQDPEKSVMNGAVLFGQNDEIIRSRIVPHTYGIAMTMEFNSRLHSKKEKYVESDGKEMANNVFRKHITIGDSVELGKWITSKEYFIAGEDKSTSRVYVFISDKKNPIHTTESGSKFIGHFDIEIPDVTKDSTEGIPDRKGVKVEFNFGGTLLRVRAVTTCSGKTQTKELQIKYNEMYKEQKER